MLYALYVTSDADLIIFHSSSFETRKLKQLQYMVFNVYMIHGSDNRSLMTDRETYKSNVNMQQERFPAQMR